MYKVGILHKKAISPSKSLLFDLSRSVLAPRDTFSRIDTFGSVQTGVWDQHSSLNDS